jgi:hypothetical protein
MTEIISSILVDNGLVRVADWATLEGMLIEQRRKRIRHLFTWDPATPIQCWAGPTKVGLDTAKAFCEAGVTSFAITLDQHPWSPDFFIIIVDGC